MHTMLFESKFVRLGLCLVCSFVAADELPKFRTDKNPDKELTWFVPVKGEFPPAGSAHYIAGELLDVDKHEREFVIRVDRNDTQQRAVWDLPLPLSMLPYGSIDYHGAPAALQDIPLGTHLHVACYVKAKDDDRPPLDWVYGRTSPEADFRQVIRVEDDFSYHARQGQSWRIDAVDLKAKKLTATRLQAGKPIVNAKPMSFDLLESTRVYTGNGFGTLQSLAAQQEVQFNLTWVGLYGPGRIEQIWIDQGARELATLHQMQRHHVHAREHGLAGWVSAVDDAKQIVTVTFFDGVDPKLFEELSEIHPAPLGWPTAGGAKDDLKPKGTLAVARHTLMTYDPTNDRQGGNLLRIGKVPVVPGCSGVQIDVQCGTLLEGYRKSEIVRFYPASWTFVGLPRDETYFGRE